MRKWSISVVAYELDKLSANARHPELSLSSSTPGTAFNRNCDCYSWRSLLCPIGGPSPAIVESLLSLVGAIQDLGAFGHGERKHATALAIFDEFARSISAATLEKTYATVQDYYNLCLLQAISTEWGADSVSINERLDAALEHVSQARRVISKNFSVKDNVDFYRHCLNYPKMSRPT